MEKSEIEKCLQEKFDNEFTLKMFTNFVLEFQECFAEDMTTEEVINRIKKNVSGNIKVKAEFENENLDGKYGADGYIEVKKSALNDEEYLKYILFHEMLHAITSVRDENGKEIMLGFSYLVNSYGMGLNEAMTEYLTQIRNSRFAPNNKELTSGYSTIVEQIRRLDLIMGGDKELKKCYFYNPDNLKWIISEKGMSYDELELSFFNFCAYGIDDDVRRMSTGKQIEKMSNCRLYQDAETIFKNYSKAIGSVNTTEDFVKKYAIFQNFTDKEHDCIDIMQICYFASIGKDIDTLLKNNVSGEEIAFCIKKLNINWNMLRAIYNFSKCFCDDKNKSAIAIYEYYSKNPAWYNAIFSRNYGMMYNHFSESKSVPGNDDLYLGFRYPTIGRLLKDHPEIDFSDISFDYIREENMQIEVVVFSSSEGNRYAYTTKGIPIEQYKDKEENQCFKLKMQTNQGERFDLNFIYDTDENMTYSFETIGKCDLRPFVENAKWEMKNHYSEREDIEYWINEGYDENGELARILDSINARVQQRRQAEKKEEIDFTE